jgi:hypothetical protein
MISDAFLSEFKRRTEAQWKGQTIDPTRYGFQFQRGTRWNPGLRSSKISEYERSLQIDFPADLRAFLTKLNGTDLPTINVYGESGIPHLESVGVYSYPRDLAIVKERIGTLSAGWEVLLQSLGKDGLKLPNDVHFVPFYQHRYVVCLSDRTHSEVVSVAGEDAIVYGWSLEEYLMKEFLSEI